MVPGARWYWLVWIVIDHIHFGSLLVVVDCTMCSWPIQTPVGLGLSRGDWDVHKGPGHRQVGDFIVVVLVVRRVSTPSHGFARLFGLNLSPNVSRIVPRSGVCTPCFIDDTMAVVLGSN